MRIVPKAASAPNSHRSPGAFGDRRPHEMGPKRTVKSTEQQVAALQMRAQKVQSRTDLAILNAALNVYPDLATSALGHVLTLAADTQENVLRKDKELRRAKKTNKNEDLRMMDNLAVEDHVPPALCLPGQTTVRGGPVNDAWLYKALCLNGCTVQTLTKILGWLEAASMSPHSLRALFRRGSGASPTISCWSSSSSASASRAR